MYPFVYFYGVYEYNDRLYYSSHCTVFDHDIQPFAQSGANTMIVTVIGDHLSPCGSPPVTSCHRRAALSVAPPELTSDQRSRRRFRLHKQTSARENPTLELPKGAHPRNAAQQLLPHIDTAARHGSMLLPRRLAAAAPRQLSRRAQSISSFSRTCRPYSSEAASAATQEAVDEPTTTPAKTKTATSATTTTSKWAKPKTAAKTSAATLSTSAASKRTAAALPSDVLYQPKTIAHTATSDVAPQEAVGVPVIDWANSFHGISSKPVTEEQFKVLMQPINEKDIEVKPDGVIYLPEIKYRRRLNEAFGPMGWGMIPKGEPVVGNTIVTREYALIVGGRYVYRVIPACGFHRHAGTRG